MAEHAQHDPGRNIALTLPDVINDSTRRLAAVGKKLGTLEIILGALTVIGLVSLILNAIFEGFDELAPWGYTAIVAGYLLSSFLAAPILAMLLRLTRSDWRRPISRIAELQAVAGVMVLILFIPLLIAIPSSKDRLTFWTIWPWGAPWFFDAVVLVLTVVIGYAFLYFSAQPDFAVARDHVSPDSARHKWYTRLSRDWSGTLKQWQTMRLGLSVLGGLYIPLYIWTVTIIYADFAQTLLPSWNSSVFPAFAVISSLQTGLAVTIVMMYVMQRWGGLEDYITWDSFWAISKLLLTTSLLWFWLWISEFMIFWYGRLPAQINVLKTVMFDVYFWPMLLTMLLNFVLPLLILMWNPVRKTVKGPTFVACLVLIGTFFDRLRIFGAGFGTVDPYAHELSDDLVPSFLTPGVLDVLIVVGGIAGSIFLVMMAVRFVPVVSIWEFGGGVGLRIRKRYLNHDVLVIAKPE